MPYAQYEITTGQIHATNSVEVSGESLAQLKAQGRAQIEVPVGVDGGRYKINLRTMRPELLTQSSSNSLHFDLVTPEALLRSDDVYMVTAPGTEGEFGVLAGHAPLISTLKPGVLAIYESATTEPAARLFVSGGLAEVNPETGCTILADEVIDLASFGTADAQKRLAEAIAALNVAADEEKIEAQRHVTIAEALVAAIP